MLTPLFERDHRWWWTELLLTRVTEHLGEESWAVHQIKTGSGVIRKWRFWPDNRVWPGSFKGQQSRQQRPSRNSKVLATLCSHLANGATQGPRGWPEDFVSWWCPGYRRLLGSFHLFSCIHATHFYWASIMSQPLKELLPREQDANTDPILGFQQKCLCCVPLKIVLLFSSIVKLLLTNTMKSCIPFPKYSLSHSLGEGRSWYKRWLICQPILQRVKNW